ncbi:MarR family transcriptional regulator [Staphylococcus equorum]|uniref:MarR family winged helix-turn-helix transcriptional regulator n=2 Tax=Staphylococcus equorum TaxID=246432 RepID=UPI0029810AC0|nr:MarR family transcriptional regulator [Staphylococcus equorum]MDW5470345.1 MarR family transcriptional regulator [Staphylococcus equorum]
MDNEEMKLTNQLCFSAYNVNRLFGKFYEQQLKQFGLTFSQYLVLLALWEESPQTLLSIGGKLDLASNTLTPVLKRLERDGWVKREKSESDKRQLIVTLTEKSHQEKNAVHKAISECIAGEFDLDEYLRAKAIMDNLELTLSKLLKDG